MINEWKSKMRQIRICRNWFDGSIDLWHIQRYSIYEFILWLNLLTQIRDSNVWKWTINRQSKYHNRQNYTFTIHISYHLNWYKWKQRAIERSAIKRSSNRKIKKKIIITIIMMIVVIWFVHAKRSLTINGICGQTNEFSRREKI